MPVLMIIIVYPMKCQLCGWAHYPPYNICYSCVGQDEHSTIATQPEDNGRSEASSDDMSATSGIKGNGHAWIIAMYTGIYILHVHHLKIAI